MKHVKLFEGFLQTEEKFINEDLEAGTKIKWFVRGDEVIDGEIEKIENGEIFVVNDDDDTVSEVIAKDLIISFADKNGKFYARKWVEIQKDEFDSGKIPKAEFDIEAKETNEGKVNEGKSDIIKKAEELLKKAGFENTDYVMSLQGPTLILTKTGTKKMIDKLRKELETTGIKFLKTE